MTNRKHQTDISDIAPRDITKKLQEHVYELAPATVDRTSIQFQGELRQGNQRSLRVYLISFEHQLQTSHLCEMRIQVGHNQVGVQFHPSSSGAIERRTGERFDVIVDAIQEWMDSIMELEMDDPVGRLLRFEQVFAGIMEGVEHQPLSDVQIEQTQDLLDEALADIFERLDLQEGEIKSLKAEVRALKHQTKIGKPGPVKKAVVRFLERHQDRLSDGMLRGALLYLGSQFPELAAITNVIIPPSRQLERTSEEETSLSAEVVDMDENA